MSLYHRLQETINTLQMTHLSCPISRRWSGGHTPPTPPFTLTRSRGCVQQAAPQDASPPKYHRDVRFSTISPRVGPREPPGASTVRAFLTPRHLYFPFPACRVQLIACVRACVHRCAENFVKLLTGNHAGAIWTRSVHAGDTRVESEVAADRGRTRSHLLPCKEREAKGHAQPTRTRQVGSTDPTHT